MNGFESRIQSVETPEGKLLHRVRIGPYETENEIEKVKVEMAEFNFDVTVVRVNDDN
jgi:cell division protein FtsN